MAKVIGTQFLTSQHPFIIIFPDQSMMVMQEGEVETTPICQWDDGGRLHIDLHWYKEIMIFKNGGWKNYKRFKEKKRREQLKCGQKVK